MILNRQAPLFSMTIRCLLSLWLFFGCLELVETLQLIPEAGVEDQLRRYPGITATQDRGIRMLTFEEFDEHLLLNGREARAAGDEALIACFQAL